MPGGGGEAVSSGVWDFLLGLWPWGRNPDYDASLDAYATFLREPMDWIGG